jgi:pimeloyl-ACP methyl ester carboxylesterase
LFGRGWYGSGHGGQGWQPCTSREPNADGEANLKLLRRALIVLAALVVLAGAALYAAVPAIERFMAFRPMRFDPKDPWRLPAGAADVFFTTEDGVRLHGWFFSAVPPRSGITVLYLHGNGGYVTQSGDDATFLREKGFDVLTVDYRGYGKSEGRTLGEATLRLDGAAAMRWLAGRGVDPATVAIYGHSLGSTVAADLAVNGPCRAVALLAPLASARRHAMAMPLFGWLPAFYFDRMVSAFDTAGKIGRARCPLLVVHGDRDEIVSFDQGRAVFDAASPPKRMVVMPGGRHHLPLDRPEVGGEVVAFFKEPGGVRPRRRSRDGTGSRRVRSGRGRACRGPARRV